LLSPHEITDVGIEMLISDEVEIADVHRITKANAASLRLEDDFAHTKPNAKEPAKPEAIELSSEDLVAELVLDEPAIPFEPVPFEPAKRSEPPPVSAAARIAPPAPRPAAAAPAPTPPPAPPARPVPPEAASAPSLDAFFRGAGLHPQRLDDKQTEQVLQSLGQIMREVVLGISENLRVRAEQKNALRLPTTTIQPQNNNPLKFSASVEEALTYLLFRESSEHLSAVDALREAFGDTRQHQEHLLSAMRTAVVDYVAQLDPEALENKIGRGSTLLGAANKLKYWDLFKDLFQVVSQCEPGQFPHQFLEELARAYDLEASRTAAPASGRQAKTG
jgi:type VI secretion system FHA domain protein